MWVSKNAKLVFVDPPKTASRSLVQVFEKAFPDFTHIGGVHIVPVLREMSGFVDYKWVMSIRNPFSRAISWLTHKRVYSQALCHIRDGRPDLINPKMSVEHFEGIQEETWQKSSLAGEPYIWAESSWTELVCNESLLRRFLPHTTFLYHYYTGRCPDIDAYIRQEYLEEDLQALGYPELRDIPVSRIGARSQTEWWKEYTPIAEEAVVRLCYDAFYRWPGFYSPVLSDAFDPERR